jgi:hypothetical protein
MILYYKTDQHLRHMITVQSMFDCGPAAVPCPQTGLRSHRLMQEPAVFVLQHLGMFDHRHSRGDGGAFCH